MNTHNHVSIVKCPGCGRGNRVRVAASGTPHCGACGEPLPWLVEADQSSFRAAVEQSSLPVLVDFWAPWCGPCRIVEPVVEQLSRVQAGHLKVVKVNSDVAPELSQRLDVLGIPTLILFEHGQVVDRVTGAPSPPTLRSWVERHLATRQPT